ncbi:MAG: DUF1015 domain-containing protein [Thermodesulfobacteriota bacterium]
MAFIAPFRGLRFNPARVPSLQAVVTPPYDVIDPAAQAALAAQHPYNMVHLDLDKGSARAGADPERYVRARDTLDRWQADQVLLRDARPGLYPYHIDYTHPNGRRLTRRGVVALVRLAELHEGIVRPHERTFGEVTSDRLRLMAACQAQFSQIFSFFSDPGGEVLTRLAAAQPEEPLATVLDRDGNRHRLWQVADPQAVRDIHAFLAGRPLYIADGHHRYTTALQLRSQIRDQAGRLAADSPYNHVAMYLCAMEDPGLAVLPTHRLVRVSGDLGVDELLARLAPWFSIQELQGGIRETLVAETLDRMDELAGSTTLLGLYHPVADRAFLLGLTAAGRATLAPELPPALRELDVVVLSELVLGQALGLDRAACEAQGLVRYFSDPDEALDVAVKDGQGNGSSELLFLMNPTPVAQVRRVADAGLTMPHKSTFFYPKILTGLVMSTLDARETITLPG